MLIVLIPLAIGYAAGKWTTRDKTLSRKDRRDLETYRTQQYLLTQAAARGAELSEGSAYQVLDILEQTRKDTSK